MRTSEAVRARRSIKRFTDQSVSREQIEALLDGATQAPNHRLTNPWRFYVLGPEARAAYGLALGNRKAKKLTDPAAADKMRESVAAEHRALPAMLVVAVVESADPEQAEEDYAATMMAINTMMLLAIEMSLGTSIKTGAVMKDPAARAAAGVAENERIVAVINIGIPSEVPPPKTRQPATSLTTWLP